MKKLLLSVAVGSALGLTGCLADGDDAPVTSEQARTPYARVTFDPAAGAVSVPNNLLFLGTTDGTLQIDDGSDESEPTVALSGLDGWSTSFPIVLSVDLPKARDNHGALGLNASSIEREGAVRVFKVFAGGELQVPGCAGQQPVIACVVQEELIYGVDFLTQSTGSGIAIAPLRPLAENTSYMVAVTDLAEDNIGRALRPSQTYFAASSDANLTGQGALIQGIIRQNHSVLDQAGVSPSSVIYSAVFTTQSVPDVLQLVQANLAEDLSLLQEQQFENMISSGVTANNFNNLTVADLLAMNVEGFPTSLPQPGQSFYAEYAVSSTASVYAGSVTLPYYSGLPDGEDLMTVLSDRWEARYVSPATIALGLQSERFAPADLVGCGLSAEVLGEFAQTSDPTVLFGQLEYEDLPETEVCGRLDDGRHLTKFNPRPRVRASLELPLWMSVPDVDVVNAVRAELGQVLGAELPAIQEPDAGWPVVIFQHGITGNKEQFLAIAGALSLSGHAAIAIDHPLHGERGFGPVNASSTFEFNGEQLQGDPTVYLNLGNLLTARDNLRQSIADIIGLRFALARPDSSFGGANINGNNVKFIGHSLGGITGSVATAIANSDFPGQPEGFPREAFFGIQQAVYGMPGGGIAQFLLDSDTFGPIIAQTIAEASGGISGSQLESVLQQFAFAAQTVVDSADPINYGGLLQSTETPMLLIQAEGDAVIPNQSGPLAGTQPLARVFGLPTVTTTTEDEEAVSAFVRFDGASHGSLLQQGPDDVEGTTLAIQLMIATWLEQNGRVLNIESGRTTE